jgi:hypothetical protein
MTWTDLEASERLERCVTELRKGFASRFEAIECGLYMQANHPAFYAVGKWVLSIDSDPRAVIAKVLNGFFADQWAKDRQFPIKALAACPQKYYGREERQAERSAELQHLINARKEREGRHGS